MGQLWGGYGVVLGQLWGCAHRVVLVLGAGQLWGGYGAVMGRLRGSYGALYAIGWYWCWARGSYGAVMGQLWGGYGAVMGQLWDCVCP